jgi:hypothetical protein
MATPFKLDHDELARCALELREAMLEFRKKVIGFDEQRMIDHELDHLAPILDLCIARKIEEPFDLIGFVNPRAFGDEIAFPELTKPYYELSGLLRGGLIMMSFGHRNITKNAAFPVKCVRSHAPAMSSSTAGAFELQLL